MHLFSNNKMDPNEILQCLTVAEEILIISVTDTRGIIQDVSNAFCEISGYTKEELIGQPHNIVRHPDTPSETFTGLWETIQSGKQWRGEIKNRRKDGGYYWVITTIFPRIDTDGKIIGYFSVRHDITALKQLKEKEELLKEQSRNASMGEMVGIIAHQWIQPISIISVQNSNLKLKMELDNLTHEDIDQTYHNINKSIEYISQTVNNFKNFFKNDKVATDTSIIELVEYAIELILPFAKENGVKISLNYDSDLDWSFVTTSKNDFAHIMMNLIKNAVEAHVDNQTLDANILIDLSKHEASYRLEVCDNAGGIPDETLPNIFDKNVSTKGEKGTGLGLYMTRLIIEQHFKGTINVDLKDEGTCFTINLPSKG